MRFIPDNFPKELDELRVIFVAACPTGFVVQDESSGEDTEICFGAVAGDTEGRGLYLFSVNENFEVIGDWFFDDIEEAMLAEQNYSGITKDDWKKIE
jgi:hypothetical protein